MSQDPSDPSTRPGSPPPFAEQRIARIAPDGGRSATFIRTLGGVVGRVHAALAEQLGATVALDAALERSALTAGEASVAIRLAGGLCVLLDEPAARGILDAVAQRTGAFQGAGAPTRVERTALEYVAARVCERLAAAGPPVGQKAWPGVEEVISAEALDRVAREAQGAPLGLDLSLCGRAGRVALLGLASGSTREPLLARPDDVLEVRVALPALDLTRAEADALEPDATILLGLPVPLASGTPVELVTTTGWRLASAQWVSYDPATIEVVVGAWDPGEPSSGSPALKSDATIERVRVTIGGAPLVDGDWWPWPAGLKRSFALAPGVGALLHRPERRSTEVELLARNGQLVARVLQA